jgi:hypothetical protein
LIFVLFNLSVSARSESAGGHAAVVTRLKGNAVVFTNSAPAAGLEVGHVTFEGENYLTVPVRAGTKLGKGDVIQTGADTQVRLIFKNGDSLSVGPATSYKINWTKDESAPLLNIFYGQVRGIFKKDGPRAGTVIHTKTSVMGVRGTDFSVTVAGATAVSVLRGEVELRANKPGSKPVSLQTGFTAKIDVPVAKKAAPAANVEGAPRPNSEIPARAEAPEPEVVITPMTKVELIDIQKKSTLKAPVDSPATGLAPADQETLSEVAALEKQAVETVMSDIKITDPVLYTQISANSVAIQDMDKVNTMAVGDLYKKAPAEKSDLKPGAKELDGLGSDAYERYFKIE